MLRTSREWVEELEELSRLWTTIPENSPEASEDEDCEAAILVQMETIARLLTQSQIRHLYEDEEFLMDAALDAERWMRQDDIPPSELWRERFSTAA